MWHHHRHRKRILVNTALPRRQEKLKMGKQQDRKPLEGSAQAGWPFLSAQSYRNGTFAVNPRQRKGQDLQECVTNSYIPLGKDWPDSLWTCPHFHQEETPCRKSRIWSGTRPHLSLRDTATLYQCIFLLFEKCAFWDLPLMGTKNLSPFLLATTPCSSSVPMQNWALSFPLVIADKCHHRGPPIAPFLSVPKQNFLCKCHQP